MSSARVLVVDDHEVVGMGLRALLANDSRWEVCGEASDGYQACEKAADLTPEVVILDLTMPGLNCFEAGVAIVAIPARRRTAVAGRLQPLACDDKRAIDSGILAPSHAQPFNI